MAQNLFDLPDATSDGTALGSSGVFYGSRSRMELLIVAPGGAEASVEGRRVGSSDDWGLIVAPASVHSHAPRVLDDRTEYRVTITATGGTCQAFVNDVPKWRDREFEDRRSGDS